MTDIYESVKNAKKIGITAHIKPDGDAIGAVLSMYQYLRKRMPEAYIKVLLEKPGISFESVPYIDVIDDKFDEDVVFDVFMILDTNRERIGFAGAYYDSAVYKINIDHHISNASGCAMENIVVPTASAACEVIYDVIDKSYIDKDIATTLYLGIAHDTGVFRFSNVSPKTLRIAADLLEYKFDFSDLLDKTFFEKTYMQNKAQGKIVIDSQLYYDGRLIVGLADKAFMDSHGVTKNDFDGVVNQLLLTQGVHVAAFIYEKADDLFKISLRACSDLVNVAKIAEALGGGGHVRAAGVDCKGSAEDVIQSIIRLVGEQLD